MSETHTTVPSDAPVFPPGRYGRRRAPGRRRPVLAGLLALGLVAVLGLVTVRLYGQHGGPEYDATVITYTGITDTQILVDFRVTVPPGGSAVCVLRARDRAGAEVAREQVRVSARPGERQVTTQHRLATSGRPFIGEVLRCRPVA
ncbi:DUF4307 domain-containing protein [Micromonospora sp. WMMA1363]|uniref:DUF4307 domain-containing protein n=1 Tax=Micromonospora sp. WMMA1363 TaxID=3053985 RepID=UPI00259C94B9|nr:DUF4307 domain-containing protein [Micromonospora sp. WMMA1363]MDM4722565.1 DUF4307 domain-containing protein [Micromonospora sp. WMMA1363]